MGQKLFHQTMKDTALFCLTARFLSSFFTTTQGSKFPDSTTIAFIRFDELNPFTYYCFMSYS